MILIIGGWAMAAQTATITIQANLPGVTISSNLFGIFFEEINSAGDGGIYAELVRNRSFEDSNNSIPFWNTVSNGTAIGQLSLDTSMPLSSSNLQSLKITMSGGAGTVGAANGGFWGIPLSQGAAYNLGFYARGAPGFIGPIIIRLESATGNPVYAQNSIGGLTTNWQHFSFSLVPNATDPVAQLTLQISQVGSAYIDFVSLFPAQTFNDRANGLRPDLAQQLADLKPSFVRFPGGSWVDGVNLADAYHWEPTVGDPANRTERYNLWGYMVSNGLGYHEYLQMCQDIGAQPLFCINCGMDVGQNAVATNQLSSWVQEALDAIQYANGDTNTFWGAQRAANGHPAPFNLQYMEIGNENNGSAYNDHYGMFYHAIKSAYPSIHLIADSQGTIPTSAPVEIVDQHYYSDPGFFGSSATLYDNYNRSGPKVFVGEYAVTSGSGNGNLAGALAEAAFMTGLERNSDVVEMASYAPLFCNLNNKDWNPDLIYFTGTQVYDTPSYYVQQMFSLNRGTVILPAVVSNANASLFVSASLVPESGLVIVKAVNVSSSTLSATLNINGVQSVAPAATVIQLASANPLDENSLALPTNVFPATNVISNVGTQFNVVLPSNSLTIYRLQAAGFESLTNLELEFPPLINAGQTVSANLFGQAPGPTGSVSLAGNHAVSYSSSDTNIAMVDASGNIAGVRPGTAAIVAAYDGLTAEQFVQVMAAPPTALIHRYSFNDGTANDSIGTNNGIFYNASGNASITNGQLNLAGLAGDYVDLGPGIITSTNIHTGAVTFEMWASCGPNNGAWTRLFDFGNIVNNAGGNYIFLSPNDAANGGDARLAVSDVAPGYNDETGFYFNNLLNQTNIHVVVVFNPGITRQFLGLYLNGMLLDAAPTANKTIASIDDAYSFLGRSLYSGSGDAWLNGSIDEFRVYDGELDRFQIAASGEAGPNATNYQTGSFTSFVLNATPSLILNSSGQVAAFLNFSQATNVSVIGDPNLMLTSGNLGVFTVDTNGLIHATGAGTATLTAVYVYVTSTTNIYTNSVTVTVLPAPAVLLAHRYSFNDGTANDSVGGANGALIGAATVSGGKLVLPNATSAAPAADYLQLPPGILTNSIDGAGTFGINPVVTIEAWATIDTGQYIWANLFDFGNQDASGQSEDDIHVCVHSGNDSTIAGISDSDNANLDYQYIDLGAGSSLDGVTNEHIVAIFNPPGNYVAVYLNGVLAGINNSVTISMSGVQDIRNIIGADNWPDPGMQGTIDEFRIYNGALSASEIAATQVLGPDQLLMLGSSRPALAAMQSGGNLTLSWPLAAAGFTVESRADLASGSWSPITAVPQIIGNQWQVTLPIPSAAEFFRLQE